MFFEILASCLGGAAILGVILKYKVDMRRTEQILNPDDYARGVDAGLERAAKIVESGEESMRSGPFSPTGVEFARAIRAARTGGAEA